MLSLTEPLRALVDPLEGVPRAVRARRWLWPLMLLMAGVAFAGAAFALRWDATGSVLEELTAGGQLATSTEQDLGVAIQTAERIKLISGVALGLLGVPLMVLTLTGFIKAVLWLLEKRASFAQLLSAVTVALLPLALFHLLLGASELWQHALTPEQMATLVPSHLAAALRPHSPVLFRVLAAVDFFSLWSVGLLGLGLSTTTALSRLHALALSLCFYGAYVAVCVVGLPGLIGGHP